MRSQTAKSRFISHQTPYRPPLSTRTKVPIRINTITLPSSDRYINLSSSTEKPFASIYVTFLSFFEVQVVPKEQPPKLVWQVQWPAWMSEISFQTSWNNRLLPASWYTYQLLWQPVSQAPVSWDRQSRKWQTRIRLLPLSKWH